MGEIGDPVYRLKRMVENVKKDPRAHTKKDLVDAAKAVFGDLNDEEHTVNKAAFIAWLINEVNNLQVLDVDGSVPEVPIPPPFPDPLVTKPPQPPVIVAQKEGELVTVVGKVNKVTNYGRSYRIAVGQSLRVPKEAAEFFRSRGYIE